MIKSVCNDVAWSGRPPEERADLTQSLVALGQQHQNPTEGQKPRSAKLQNNSRRRRRSHAK
eukprot:6170859-Amphidinium_carterae.1